MPVASRKNTVAENETPISSTKYNEEIDNLYQNLNQSLSFYAGAIAPAEALPNQYWLDTGVSPAILRRYSGDVWIWTGIFFGTTAPANPASGAMYIDSAAGTMGYWDGTGWISLPGTAIGFDPTDTDMTATNLQDALKELAVQYSITVSASQAAAASASAASISETNAGGSEAAALTAMGRSESARDRSESARDRAEAADSSAEKWAEEVEDTPVATGQYSSLHWAAKALASATSAGADAIMAEKWAEEATDIPVATGQYSAKHWAEKAQGSATVGPEGKSAYDLAVLDGFSGTLTEWLASLDGAKGEPGVGVPAIAAGDGGKLLAVKSDESTFETVALHTLGFATLDLATTEAKGLMSAEDKTKLDGVGAGGSSVMLTLVHTTIPQSTTATTYDVLATGKIIGRSDWHGPELSMLLRRSGSGQVRISLSDGTTTVTAETASFAASGTDELTLDTTALTDGVTWNLTVEALTDDAGVTVERLKILADPVNEFSPVMAVAKAGNSMSGSTFAELDLSYFMAAGVNVDAAGGVVALCDVDLGTATEAELRVTVSGAGSSESVTATVAASGVTEIRCPYPPVASAVASCRVEGRVTAGSGTIALNHYQLHVER